MGGGKPANLERGCDMSTTVSYKGSTIATVDNNTKTLTTQGKYLEADIILTDVSGGGGGGTITQDQDGYLVLSPDGGGGGSGGVEYEEGTWTPSADTAIATISFANSHTSPPMIAYMFDSAPDTMGSASDTYFGCCTAFIGGLIDNIQDASFPFYGVHRRRYAVGSESRASFNSLTTVSNYITNTQFMPQGNNTGAYWRAGRTYKWIAVWPPTT